MDIGHLSASIKKLVAQRNIFLLFSLLLTLAVVLLSLLLLLRKERTVFVPLSGSSLWIEEGRASSNYIEKMGVFIADLMLNRTPADVEWKNKTLLEYVHPKFYHQIARILEGDKEAIVKNDQTFVFKVKRSFVDAAKMSFLIEGESLVLISRTGKTPVCTQQEMRSYRFGFLCENGKVLLISLTKGEA